MAWNGANESFAHRLQPLEGVQMSWKAEKKARKATKMNDGKMLLSRTFYLFVS